MTDAQKASVLRAADQVWEDSLRHRSVSWAPLVTSAEGRTMCAQVEEIAPGGEIHAHTHEVMEVIYQLEGRAHYDTPEGTWELGPGDRILMPAGLQHVARNTGAAPARALCVYSPAREDR